jgi:hypothetical protein
MRFRTCFRPSPAMVVAIIALLAALGGTGVAAVGALAPKNSVGSAQVIDGSLLRKDFKARQIPQGARGPAGPAGPAGAAGAAGAAGPAGPSDAFSRSVAGGVTLGSTEVAVASLPIPTAGKYVVWGQTSVSSADNAVSCALFAGTNFGSFGRGQFATLSRISVSAIGVREFTAPGTVELRCVAVSAAPASNISITAIKVANLTSTSA